MYCVAVCCSAVNCSSGVFARMFCLCAYQTYETVSYPPHFLCIISLLQVTFNLYRSLLPIWRDAYETVS